LPSTRFLFWNINRQPLAGLIADLAQIHEIDVIILAECRIPPGSLLRALNRQSAAFHLPSAIRKGLAMYTRFSAEFLKPSFDGERFTIRRLVLPSRLPVLLAAVHLPSKLHWTSGSQAIECGELAREIERQEQAAGHHRTILVGDFNMNPFEDGLVGDLSSVMSRSIASRLTRSVQGREYRFFYNPMWGHFGDFRDGTAGSYYYDGAQHVNHYWNIYDQVLLRPELATDFKHDHLRIIKEIGGVSLVRPDGRPDTTLASDHLPLVFEVEF
jgi:hypothetical protein